MQELIKKIINFVLDQSSRPGAIYLLFTWSFVEAWFIIPIPPDALLIPMSIANRSRAYFYAYMTTISSVIGGLVGYLIGFYAIDFAMSLRATRISWFASEVIHLAIIILYRTCVH